MPKTIYDADFLELLPESMKQDKRYVALAKAVAQEERRIASEIWRVLIWPNFSGLSDDVMDILRYDLNISQEEFQGTTEEKQKILTAARFARRKAGTKSAVLRSIDAIFAKADVKEWFEYDGEPYHFLVNVDATDIRTTQETYDSLLERILKAKNLRSELDGIAISDLGKSPGKIFVAGVMSAEETVTVKCEKPNHASVMFLADENGNFLADDNRNLLYEAAV